MQYILERNLHATFKHRVNIMESFHKNVSILGKIHISRVYYQTTQGINDLVRSTVTSNLKLNIFIVIFSMSV